MLVYIKTINCARELNLYKPNSDVDCSEEYLQICKGNAITKLAKLGKEKHGTEADYIVEIGDYHKLKVLFAETQTLFDFSDALVSDVLE